MLVLQGHNQLGNVLHVIVGTEGELYTDIHGASVMDVTAVLSKMNFDQRVFLSITRCKHESQTSATLTANKIQHLNSFSERGLDLNSTQASAPRQEEQEPETKAKCTYCGRTDILLPIPNFKICTACAQIELGRSSQQAEDVIKQIATDGDTA